jgi:hypothetical protein
MNTQRCRVQMLRSYFGEPEGEKCGLCDSDAGLDSEVFDPGSADERHGLHAATDFHARPRRRRRGRGGHEAPAPMAPAAPPPIVFETAIPGDVPPPLPPYEVPAPPESEQTFDEGLWAGADAGAGDSLAGDAVVDPSEYEAGAEMAAAGAGGADGAQGAQGAPGAQGADGAPPPGDEAYTAGWAGVRDANIRPYVEWRSGAPVALPVLPARPTQQGGGGHGHQAGGHGHGGGHHQRGGGPGGRFDGGGGGGGGGGRRRKRRGRNRDRDQRRDHHRNRDRERGPRLPGVYNPGGD